MAQNSPQFIPYPTFLPQAQEKSQKNEVIGFQTFEDGTNSAVRFPLMKIQSVTFVPSAPATPGQSQPGQWVVTLSDGTTYKSDATELPCGAPGLNGLSFGGLKFVSQSPANPAKGDDVSYTYQPIDNDGNNVGSTVTITAKGGQQGIQGDSYNIGDVFFSANPNPSRSIPWVAGADIDFTKFPGLKNCPILAGGKIPGQTANDFFRVANGSIDAGQTQGDAIRNIAGGQGNVAMTSDNNYGTGAFTKNQRVGNGACTNPPAIGENYAFNFDASSMVPTADENRPNSTALNAFIYTGVENA